MSLSMQSLSERFRVAMIELHRRKTLDYGIAWKKRGEVLSVLANIARKVDRIETVANRNVATRDEPLLDTYIDLLVYALKYETLLADLYPEAARTLDLPKERDGVHSDGLMGFEQIVATLELGPLDQSIDLPPHSPQDVATAFNVIERCFSGLSPSASSLARLTATKTLAEISVRGVAHTARATPEQLREFIVSHTPTEA